MVISTLITALAEHDRPLVVVVDDYHLITNDAIHQGMERLVELCPPQVTVVISTRFDPPFRLGRLRVRGHLLEVRSDGLRFQPAEAATLLGTGPGSLEPREIDLLSTRTEGWAAGLVLARLSIARVSDPSRFVEEFHGDDQLVVDYLSDEFLAGVSPDHRHRLLTTSILGQMSGSLVDALTGSNDGTTWLNQTATENQLVIGLDRTGEWYRYHHLLRDLLRLEANASIPDQLPELHRRAAAWFESAGDHQRAVAHRLDAGDRQDAARLMFVLGPELIAGNQIETLRGILVDLGDVAETDTVCALLWGWCEYIAGRFDSAERWVELTHRIAPDGFDQIITAPLRMNILLARGDVQSALVIARECSDLGRLRSLPTELANIATVAGAAHMWAGQTDDARAVLAVAVEKTENTDNYAVHVLAQIYQSLVAFDAGDVAAARDAAVRAISTADELGLGPYHRLGPAYAVRARTGDGTDAVADAQRAVESVKRTTGDLVLAYVLTMCGDVLADADDPAGLEHLAEARSVVNRCPDPGIVARYLDRIESRHAITTTAVETPAIVEQLTERETAVLRYLPTALSQREIAGELFVSPNTVKTHCTAIYRKLAVDNRKAAVQTARELGLL
jgi:LuxR family maltose regulon positive regulatory protein